MYNENMVLYFPGLSVTLKHRKEYNQVKKRQQEKNLPFSLLHPATLRISLSWKGGANFECCVFKQQPTNPTRYSFKTKGTFLFV